MWITELAINKWARMGPGNTCNNCNITREMTDAYMQAVLPALEESDAVFRYAWYTAKDLPQHFVNEGNLLVANETIPALTSTGVIYKAHHDAQPNGSASVY